MYKKSFHAQKELKASKKKKKIGPKLQITKGSSKKPANPLSNA